MKGENPKCSCGITNCSAVLGSVLRLAMGSSPKYAAKNLSDIYLYSIPGDSPVCDTSSQVDLSQLDLHLKRGGVYSHVWKEYLQ